MNSRQLSFCPSVIFVIIVRRITDRVIGNRRAVKACKPIFNSAVIDVCICDGSITYVIRGISEGSASKNVSTIIILINIGFVKRFVVCSYKLSEGILT